MPNTYLRLLISQTGIAPREKMVRGILGESQERRKKGQGLQTGKETGSGSRRTVAEGLKDRGATEQERSAVPKKPALGSKRAGTTDTGVRTQHKNHWPYRVGQNNQTDPTEFLVAKDERSNHRLR